MLYFIVNPTSRSGKGLEVWNKCVRILEQRQMEYEVFLLNCPEDAVRAAREAMRFSPCTAVVVGGDGTINAFLSGLSSYRGITFAFIPTGSGNDFARGMHSGNRPEPILEKIIREEQARQIDIGLASSHDRSRSFAVSSGIGFDAAVCYAAESSSNVLKKALNFLHMGKLVYLINALRMLLSMKLFRMKAVIDDQPALLFEKVCFAAAMNTAFEGGGFQFAPDADPGDGLLDLIIAEGIPKWKILLILPTAFSGKHLRYKGIHLIRCSRAVLQCSEAQCVHTDGEHLGFCKTVKFSVQPEKLNVIS